MNRSWPSPGATPAWIFDFSHTQLAHGVAGRAGSRAVRVTFGGSSATAPKSHRRAKYARMNGTTGVPSSCIALSEETKIGRLYSSAVELFGVQHRYPKQVNSRAQVGVELTC